MRRDRPTALRRVPLDNTTEAMMWSWIIAGTGITAMWLAGYDDARRWAGWALAIFGQLLWIVYALHTAQYGFVAGAIVAGTVFARNAWRAWRQL